MLNQDIANKINNPYYLYHHQPLESCDEYLQFGPAISPSLNCCIPTKNLLLVDRKKNFFLVSGAGDTVFDLKLVSKAVGAKGRVKFANTQEIKKTLDLGI